MTDIPSSDSELDEVLYNLATEFADVHQDNVEGTLSNGATRIEYDSLLEDAKAAIQAYAKTIAEQAAAEARIDEVTRFRGCLLNGDNWSAHSLHRLAALRSNKKGISHE